MDKEVFVQKVKTLLRSRYSTELAQLGNDADTIINNRIFFESDFDVEDTVDEIADEFNL